MQKISFTNSILWKHLKSCLMNLVLVFVRNFQIYPMKNRTTFREVNFIATLPRAQIGLVGPVGSVGLVGLYLARIWPAAQLMGIKSWEFPCSLRTRRALSMGRQSAVIWICRSDNKDRADFPVKSGLVRKIVAISPYDREGGISWSPAVVFRVSAFFRLVSWGPAVTRQLSWKPLILKSLIHTEFYIRRYPTSKTVD